MPQLRVLVHSRQFLGEIRIRYLYCKDSVIETGIGRCVFSVDSPSGVDQHVIRFHADLCQHGTEHRYLVFTIAITMAKDFAGRMRTITADAYFDGVIAYVALGKKR